jgi:hypothetical protein
MPTPTFPTRSIPWVPRIQVAFIEPLVVTAKKLIERDQVEALAWASPDITLKPFQHILYSRREKGFFEARVSAYPLVIIAPGKTLPPFGNEERSIPEERNDLAVEIAIVGGDPDALTIQIMRYVKAVDMIWRSASVADLTWNLSSSHTTRFITDVTEHSYSVIAEDGPNAYFHTALLTLMALNMEA